MKKESSHIRLFIDAVEDGVARVILGEDTLSVPMRLLPEGAVEGAWIELSTRVIPPPRAVGADTDRRRERLVSEDPGGPIKL